MLTFNKGTAISVPKLAIVLFLTFWANPLVAFPELMGAWSPSVDGLKARLSVTDLGRDAGGNEKVKVSVEFQRTPEIWGIKSLHVGAISMFDWKLVDADGHDAVRIPIGGGSIFSEGDFWVELPSDSSFRIPISEGDVSSYKGNMRFILAMDATEMWEIVRGRDYRLSATFQSRTDSRDTDHQAIWKGKLEVPEVVLPSLLKIEHIPNQSTDPTP